MFLSSRIRCGRYLRTLKFSQRGGVLCVCVCAYPDTKQFLSHRSSRRSITRIRMASSNAIREEYLSSLADLDQNSKPMIDMLTMLAEDHRQHAPIIVDAIKQRIAQVLHFFVFYDYYVCYFIISWFSRHPSPWDYNPDGCARVS